MEERCPNCNSEYKDTWITDCPADEILISVAIKYCPECLYVAFEDVTLSK